MSPQRLCLEPSCPAPAAWRGRCRTHARNRERTFRRAGQRIYRTKRWQATRRKQLFDHPLCHDCGQIATDVDHLTPLDQGGDPWNPANLQSLCKGCHGRKTRREQLTA